MEHGTVLVTLIFGVLGQAAKSHPGIKNWIPTLAMLLIGLGWYAGNHGVPSTALHGTAAFAAWTDWIEAALFAATAIPGTASVLGMIPGLKTRELPKP